MEHLNLKNKVTKDVKTNIPHPLPLIRDPPTREGIITACVKASINYKNIQYYFNLCNKKLDNNCFLENGVGITLNKFNERRNDIINRLYS